MVIFPFDWDKDGIEDLLVSDKNGFLYFFRKTGDFPDFSVENVGIVRDCSKNLPFNIPYENPNHPELDNLGGYFSPLFFNMIYPTVYPSGGNTVDLILGDWAGNLWWMPDLSDGGGRPVYEGITYTKDEAELDPILNKEYYKEFFRKYGNRYCKPKGKICDEQGAAFLLGMGKDGDETYRGCNTRPLVYKNRLTGLNDLLVFAGVPNTKAYYLKRMENDDSQKPVFKNLGEIKIKVEDKDFFSGCSSGYGYPIIVDNNGWNDLLISNGIRIAVCRNKKIEGEIPEFEFDRWISDKDIFTAGKFFTDTLETKDNRRFFLEVNWSCGTFEMREIEIEDNKVWIAPEITIKDQNGIFRVEGETDPNLSPIFGTNRIARWDFDNSGRKHLVVGTDRGLIYLLKEDKAVELTFNSYGPLKDSRGQVIKVHNRLGVFPLDLTGEGADDLILGSASYQCGVKTDPTPGGGIYYLLNKGLDSEGIPDFDPVKPLPIEGYRFDIGINSIVRMQVLDIDGDGEKEAIISLCGFEDNILRIYKANRDRVGLRYIGKIVLPFYGFIDDIDLDGELEVIWPGGEQGMGYYQKIGYVVDEFVRNTRAGD